MGGLSLGSAVSYCVRRFPLKVKGIFYKRPAILYVRVAWCQRESEMGILQRTERSMVRAIS